MQEFSTTEVRHEFKVDGILYWLPGITMDDLETSLALAAAPAESRVAAFRNFMAGRVRSSLPWWRFERSGRRAVGRLRPEQLTDLYQGWMTVGHRPGESSGSLVLPSSSDEN